jgi:AcrR family transcriptional regulator
MVTLDVSTGNIGLSGLGNFMVTDRVRVRKKSGQYHHGQLKSALVLAAEHYIGKTGTVEVPLREVAKLAGVSHAAAYRHFESKTALMAEVARRGFNALAATLDDATAVASTPDLRLEEASVAYVRFALESPGAFRVMFHTSLKPFTAHQGLPEAASLALNILRTLVHSCIPRASDGQVAVMTTWAAIHGQAMLFVDGQLEGPFGVGPAAAELATRRMMRWLALGRRPAT